MSCLLYAFTLALILPISAQASSTANVINTNCSGSLTSSLIDGASFACAGNLTLDGGFITSDSLINIFADGDLFLDNLNFTAPNVTFSNKTGLIKIGSDVVINGGSVTVSSSGGAISILGTIDVEGRVVVSNRDTILIKDYESYADLSSSVDASNGKGGDLGIIVTLPKIPQSGIVSLIDQPLVGGAYDAPVVLTAVPEPSTYAMVFLGLALILLKRRV